MSLESDVDFEVLSRLCQDMSGADIKSIVCDSFLKAFHRLHTSASLLLVDDENKIKEKLRSSIKIAQLDFISSIESIQQTINKNERTKLKKMYVLTLLIVICFFDFNCFFLFLKGMRIGQTKRPATVEMLILELRWLDFFFAE